MRNILLIHCHDLGRFVGAYGVETVSTPHLDTMAEESVLFEQAFSTAPHCSPARASLFTGNYPQSNGVLGLTHEPFDWDLNDPKTHLAHRLKTAGYQTELVGVHHESRVLADEVVAERLGFDRARTGGARDVVVERATEALRRMATENAPFYLQVGFTEPHRVPSERDRPGVMGFLADGVDPDAARGLTVPGHLVDDPGAREEIAELQGAVRHMDEGVGSILAALEALGLRDETLVVFTTDHGLALPRAKCTLYDAGLGVAMMIRNPAHPAWRSRRIAGIVSHVDVVPTLLDLTGLPVPDRLPGTSLRPAVESGEEARTHCFSQLSYHTYYDPKRSVRTPTHKLIVNFSNAPRAMDPTQSWVHRSLPADLNGPTIGTSPVRELYDLRTDPEELENLAEDPAQEDTLASLSAALLDWMRECEDPLLNTGTATKRHRDALQYLLGARHAPTPVQPELAIS
ncbi:sulfatase family protein [Paeniglutamicibacter kerguelensis]|uniref:Arylsulfatase A-like enzyme n=1 Tax=Paeniglutamicibacter kerguelensis TaxID=254788 RepID=A0ABS4XHH7_9MICC|nr:sulfatase [Paeniglutamicibacter kerguelensis]MBP2387858.1 arylsulfatase A-like enzyme [Paeniglutamicibacter kerguelensis]